MIAAQQVLQRVLILADESASWRVAGLSQLHRILLSLNQYALSTGQTVPVSVSIAWKPGTPEQMRQMPDDERLTQIEVTESESQDLERFDIVLSTRVFLYRNAISALVGANIAPPAIRAEASWDDRVRELRRTLSVATKQGARPEWQYLADPSLIASAERLFLRHSGKSQDGLVSQYLNRPISREVSRWLLKTRITPSTWSTAIFVLPLLACFSFLQGTAPAFIVGCLIFQLYSILDGCDGEIARARFQHTEFGRRLDSLLDLTGNMLLALCLGIGLALQAWPTPNLSWFYAIEGAAAAACVVLSEGIVFLRRSRRDQQRGTTALNGALYHRHN